MPLNVDGCSLWLQIKEAFCGVEESFQESNRHYSKPFKIFHFLLIVGKREPVPLLMYNNCRLPRAQGQQSGTNDNRLNPWLRNGLTVCDLSGLDSYRQKLLSSSAIVYMYATGFEFCFNVFKQNLSCTQITMIWMIENLHRYLTPLKLTSRVPSK